MIGNKNLQFSILDSEARCINRCEITKSTEEEVVSRQFIASCIEGSIPKKINLIKNKNIIHEGMLAACENSHIEVVKYLYHPLRKTCRVDLHIYDEEALMLSCSNGDLDLVKFLVNMGCNPRARCDLALTKAARSGNPMLFEFLLSQSLDIKSRQYECLLEAVKHDNRSIITLILANGGKATVKNDICLIYASEAGNIKLAEYLIDKGCSPTSQAGKSLHVACKNGDILMFNTLLRNSDINSLDLRQLLRNSIAYNCISISELILNLIGCVDYVDELRQAISLNLKEIACMIYERNKNKIIRAELRDLPKNETLDVILKMC